MESFGKYQVVELIGEGGFGKVWKGYDPGLKRYVAIKTVSLSAPEARERFDREAEIAANLHHPAIVTIHDFGSQDGLPYLVQEFLAGEDLAHKIARRDAGDLRRRTGWLLQVAEGLHYAHQFGVIHRDIKPSNIRILPDGAVRIMDFGIAKIVDSDQRLTGTALSVGTSGYVSPEALEGRSIDHRADIFSFGVMAYELLTYVRPFDGPSVQSTLYRILTEEPDPIASLLPDCPPALIAIVDRCLRKQRDERYADLADVAADLRRVIDPPPTADVPSPQQAPGAGSTAAAAGATRSTMPLPRTAPSAAPPAPPPVPPSPPTGEPVMVEPGGTGMQKLGIAVAAVLVIAALAWAGTSIATRFTGNRGTDPDPLGSNDSASQRLARTDSFSGRANGFPRIDSGGPAGSGVDGRSGGSDSPRGGSADSGSASPTGGTPRGSTGDGGSANGTRGGASGSGTEGGGTRGGGGIEPGGQTVVPEKVLVLISGPRADAVSTAETIVLNELMAQGRPIVDPSSIDRLRADDAAMRALAAGASPASGIGRAYGAGIVVVADLTTGAAEVIGGFVTGSASINARFYDSLTGALITTGRYEIGSGNTPGRAAPTESAAIAQAAESVARQLARAILQTGR